MSRIYQVVYCDTRPWKSKDWRMEWTKWYLIECPLIGIKDLNSAKNRAKKLKEEYPMVEAIIIGETRKDFSRVADPCLEGINTLRGAQACEGEPSYDLEEDYSNYRRLLNTQQKQKETKTLPRKDDIDELDRAFDILIISTTVLASTLSQYITWLGPRTEEGIVLVQKFSRILLVPILVIMLLWLASKIVERGDWKTYLTLTTWILGLVNLGYYFIVTVGTLWLITLEEFILYTLFEFILIVIMSFVGIYFVVKRYQRAMGKISGKILLAIGLSGTLIQASIAWLIFTA